MKSINLLTVLIFFCTRLFAQPVIEPVATNARWGGRSVAITVHSVFNNEMIAASATGGLFKSVDDGNTWRHLDNLPVFNMMDVKYNPVSHNQVIATSLRDTDTSHKVGIWLSDDRGETWRQLDVEVPVPASARANFNTRFSGYGISFDHNGVAYVGTDYGIAMGTSGHRRWQFILHDTRIRTAADKLQYAVFSVCAFGSGRLLVGARSGVYYCRDMYLREPFRKSMTALKFDDGTTHGIARSPYNEKDFLITPNVNEFYLSMDTGLYFTAKAMPSFERVSRMPVVAMVRNPDRADYIDVYVHKVKLFKKTCFKSELNLMDGSWEQMDLKHDDMSGYAIVGNELRYITGDGGVFKKSGNTWNSIGKGGVGYNALQVYQVWGQKILHPEPPAPTPGSFSAIPFPTGPQVHYFFGTQDNDIWATENGGRNWYYSLGIEGGGFDGPRVVENFASRKFVFVDNSPGKNRYYLGDLLRRYNWPDPGQPSGNPKYAGDNTFLQIFIDTVSGDVRIMKNRNMSRWEEVARISGYSVWQGEKPSIETDFTMYFPYARALPFTNGFSNVGLFQLKKKTGEDRRITYELRSMDTVSTMGSMMVYAADFAWPTVYGFDYNDPDKLLAPDVENKVMKWSTNGGLTWRPDFNLTRLITENGKYLFCESVSNMSVWSVSFNPSNSRQIAIGTKDAGLIYTSDGGTRWCRIPGSKAIPNITSIWWDFDGTALVSSYGRSLWRFTPASLSGTPATECVTSINVMRLRDIVRPLADHPLVIDSVNVSVLPQARMAIARNLLKPLTNLSQSKPVAGIVSGTVRGGEMVVGENGRVTIQGYGFSTSSPVSAELNGIEYIHEIPVNKDGTIKYPMVFKVPPGIYTLNIIQYINNKKVETPLILKVPFADK